jgi:lysyl-tRNA synthetase class 2
MEPGGESWQLAKKHDALWLRARMIQALRQFFHKRDYLEVETPVRIPAPAPEEHIDAPTSGDWFLQTSPELCMKRLVAVGYSRIFQISRCFREAERGRLHLPEFTLLEWYRQGVGYRDLMAECEDLILHVAGALGKGDALIFRGKRVSLQKPWPRISVQEAFARHATLSLPEALEEACFDEIMACEIEPRLGIDRPTFLFDYPIALGALARAKDVDPGLAERFELYLGGLELANAFSELTDEAEQRRRFEKARQFRLVAGKREYPLPEPFLKALREMPDAAGIALGVDRLAMLLTDAATIDEVVAFTPEML